MKEYIPATGSNKQRKELTVAQGLTLRKARVHRAKYEKPLEVANVNTLPLPLLLPLKGNTYCWII